MGLGVVSHEAGVVGLGVVSHRAGIRCSGVRGSHT